MLKYSSEITASTVSWEEVTGFIRAVEVVTYVHAILVFFDRLVQ